MQKDMRMTKVSLTYTEFYRSRRRPRHRTAQRNTLFRPGEARIELGNPARTPPVFLTLTPLDYYKIIIIFIGFVIAI